MDRAGRMKLLLETSFQCRCPRLEDCEQFLRSAKRKQAVDQRIGAADILPPRPNPA